MYVQLNCAIIDADPANRQELAGFLERFGLQVVAQLPGTDGLPALLGRPDGPHLIIVNLDPHHTQRGWVSLPLERWGIGPTDNLQFHDLLTDARFVWSGRRIYVELDPQFVPAHVLVLRRYVRTERDFDYFL